MSWWRLSLAGAVLALLVVLQGCGPGKSCGPSNCTGCCDSNNRCQGGLLGTACGTGGKSCTTCAAIEVCQIGFCVHSGSGGGGGGSGLNCPGTCAGCCDSNSQCQAGVNNSACGSGGATCQVCVGNQACSSAAGPKLCRSASCTGCVASDGGCQTGSGDTACGMGGVSCQSCQNGASCNGVGVCTGGTCSGCRDLSGACQPGNAKGACGTGGASCASCTGSRVCVAGACVEPDGGTDGGTDGGSDGGPVAGDRCSNPLPLTFDGGVATVSGSTAGAWADYESTGGCLSRGPDLVYGFTNSSTQDFRAEVYAPGHPPALYLRGGSCPGVSDVTCHNAQDPGGTLAWIDYPSLGAGTYYLFVDGTSSTSSGSYQLAVKLGSGFDAGGGDNCGSAAPLPLSNGSWGTAQGSGTTAGFTNDTSTSCGGSGPDVVYSITTVDTRNVGATLTSNSSSYQPVLSLRTSSGCSGTSGVIGCWNASSSGVGISGSVGPFTLDAGTYLFWVDGYGGTAGSYTLDVNVE